MTPAAFLESIPFCRDSPTAVRTEMARGAQRTILQAGEPFYREGESCAHFALVCGGDIRVFKSDGEGREVTLYHVGAGEPCLLNILSVMLRRPAMANAFAEVETSAFLFPGEMLDRWMGASPALRLFVFESLAARMEGVMSLVEDIAFRRIESRLATYLLHGFEQERVIEATHERIAAELGTAREVVSRVMRDLTRRGAIQSARGRIVLRDAEVLRQIM